MQETLHQTADAGSRRLYQTAVGCRIRQRMQESLYQKADDSLSDSGCRRLSIRQRMQESLYQTADAGDSLSDSGCRRLSIRQRMQETLYQTADAEVSLSDSGCRSLSSDSCLRQWMQDAGETAESLSIRPAIRQRLYQTADAGDSPSDSGQTADSLSEIRCLTESLLQRVSPHPLSDRESHASAV